MPNPQRRNTKIEMLIAHSTHELTYNHTVPHKGTIIISLLKNSAGSDNVLP